MSCATATRGFTLIELVTSIVIIGVLGAVAAPHFFDTAAFNERGYIDEVGFTLRYAQKIAIASECSVSVAITAAGYVVNQQSAAGNTCDTAGSWTAPVRRTDGSALAGSAPSNVVLAPAVTIILQSDGSLAGAAPPLLTTGSFTLGIDKFSGRVTVLP